MILVEGFTVGAPWTLLPASLTTHSFHVGFVLRGEITNLWHSFKKEGWSSNEFKFGIDLMGFANIMIPMLNERPREWERLDVFELETASNFFKLKKRVQLTLTTLKAAQLAGE